MIVKNLPRCDEQKYHFSKWHLLLCLFINASVFFFSISSIVLAQNGYPQPTDLYVNDYANLLTSEDEINIKALLSNLKQDTDIEAVVVTINSINDYGTPDETIESFATNIFNTWGIGDKHRNDGVLILVAAQDRRVRIEVGSGYDDTQNSNMQEVINEHILPHFRQDNYSEGIYQGVHAVVNNLTGNSSEPSRHTITTILGYEITTEQIVRLVNSQGFWYGIIIVSLSFVIYLLRRRRRRRYYMRGYGYYSDYGDGGRHSSGGSSFGGGDSSGGGASGDW